MAAPKHWGYTRQKPFTDELLVSWADGDVTEMLAKEMVERMLRHRQDRQTVAAYARACTDTATPHRDGERDWLIAPRPGLTALCREMVDANPDWGSLSPPPPRHAVSWNTLVAAGFGLVLLAALVVWMVRVL
jgi:hypothetical protein